MAGCLFRQRRGRVFFFAIALVPVGFIGREGVSLSSLPPSLREWSSCQMASVSVAFAGGVRGGFRNPAAYHAPILGAVFAALIVLGNFSMSLSLRWFLHPVATMVSRSFWDIRPWYTVPRSSSHRSRCKFPGWCIWELITGASGADFQAAPSCRGGLQSADGDPIYLRMALGGFAVGVLALDFRRMGEWLRHHQPHPSRRV